MSLGAWLELLASGLITGGIYALVALGLNLQYGLMRILNIAHGEFLMLGAYFTWMMQTAFGVSPLWMLPASFALLMMLGLAVHWLCFRRLAASSPNLDVFEARGLMVSFGLLFLVQNFISFLWAGELRGDVHDLRQRHADPDRHARAAGSLRGLLRADGEPRPAHGTR